MALALSFFTTAIERVAQVEPIRDPLTESDYNDGVGDNDLPTRSNRPQWRNDGPYRRVVDSGQSVSVQDQTFFPRTSKIPSSACISDLVATGSLIVLPYETTTSILPQSDLGIRKTSRLVDELRYERTVNGSNAYPPETRGVLI